VTQKNNDRLTASQRRAKKTSNPYMTTSASQRRAAERAKAGKGASTEVVQNKELDVATIREMLAHPTKVVTTEDLKREYGYVLNDIRNMFTVAAGLIALLVILALVLPR
jgi:hypothetical protein